MSPTTHVPAVEAAGAVRDHPDSCVISHQDVPGLVDRHAARSGHPGAGGRAIVTGESAGASAGGCVDVPRGHPQPVEDAVARGDDANPVVGGVGDDDVAVGADCEASWIGARAEFHALDKACERGQLPETR